MTAAARQHIYVPERNTQPPLLPTETDRRWEQRTGALPENVGVLRAGVVAFADRHGWDAARRGDIALAVSEALTNAVVHGFAGRPPGTLVAIAETRGDDLVVHVIDDGRGRIQHASSPGMGLGVPIMTRATSHLDIRDGPGGCGTATRLTFTRPYEADDRPITSRQLQAATESADQRGPAEFRGPASGSR